MGKPGKLLKDTTSKLSLLMLNIKKKTDRKKELQDLAAYREKVLASLKFRQQSTLSVLLENQTGIDTQLSGDDISPIFSEKEDLYDSDSSDDSTKLPPVYQKAINVGLLNKGNLLQYKRDFPDNQICEGVESGHCYSKVKETSDKNDTNNIDSSDEPSDSGINYDKRFRKILNDSKTRSIKYNDLMKKFKASVNETIGVNSIKDSGDFSTTSVSTKAKQRSDKLINEKDFENKGSILEKTSSKHPQEYKSISAFSKTKSEFKSNNEHIKKLSSEIENMTKKESQHKIYDGFKEISDIGTESKVIENVTKTPVVNRISSKEADDIYDTMIKHKDTSKIKDYADVEKSVSDIVKTIKQKGNKGNTESGNEEKIKGKDTSTEITKHKLNKNSIKKDFAENKIRSKIMNSDSADALFVESVSHIGEKKEKSLKNDKHADLTKVKHKREMTMRKDSSRSKLIKTKMPSDIDVIGSTSAVRKDKIPSEYDIKVAMTRYRQVKDKMKGNTDLNLINEDSVSRHFEVAETVGTKMKDRGETLSKKYPAHSSVHK